MYIHNHSSVHLGLLQFFLVVVDLVRELWGNKKKSFLFETSWKCVMEINKKLETRKNSGWLPIITRKKFIIN